MSRRIIRDREKPVLAHMKPVIETAKDEEFLRLVAVQLFEKLGIFINATSREETLDAGSEVLELLRIYAKRKKGITIIQLQEIQNKKKRHLGGYQKQLVHVGFTTQ